MATTQSAALDRKKLMGDPILVTTIVVLITFLTLFILYPLAILLVDSFYSKNGLTLGILDIWLAPYREQANVGYFQEIKKIKGIGYQPPQDGGEDDEFRPIDPFGLFRLSILFCRTGRKASSGAVIRNVFMFI